MSTHLAKGRLSTRRAAGLYLVAPAHDLAFANLSPLLLRCCTLVTRARHCVSPPPTPLYLRMIRNKAEGAILEGIHAVADRGARRIGHEAGIIAAAAGRRRATGNTGNCARVGGGFVG